MKRIAKILYAPDGEFLYHKVQEHLAGLPRFRSKINRRRWRLMRRLACGGGHFDHTGDARSCIESAFTGEHPSEKEAIQLYPLRLFKQDVPQEIWDRQMFSQVHWIGDEKPADSVIPQSMMIANLTAMRQAMIQNSQAEVFIGGKTTDFYGAKPGIRDEYERFLAFHPQGPVYLVGLLEGETKKIITELEQQQQREPNGLTDRQLRIIHHGDNIDLIAPVIVTNIARCVKKDKRV